MAPEKIPHIHDGTGYGIDHLTQSDFSEVYWVEGQNMKKLDCPSFPMVCSLMFCGSGLPEATRLFGHRIKGGTPVKK